MMDFLKFKSFIAIEVLMIFYYLGAVVMPLLLFYLLKRYNLKLPNFSKRGYFVAIFIVAFLFGELFWRVGFEAIIGYFQMVEASKGR